MPSPLPDGQIDTLGFLDAVLGMPEQVESAAARGPIADLPRSSDIDHVVISAGSGLAPLCGLVGAATASVATVPVVSVDGPFPAFVGPRSLVLAVGGDLPEVRGAVAAAATGARVVPVAVEHATGLQRTGLAGALVSVLLLLEQLGQYAELESSASAAADQLRRRRVELTAADDPGHRLARRVGRTLPLVYGGDATASAVADRWKQQINLGAKAASFANGLPGLGADELAGWGQHGDMTRQVFSLVVLRHDHEPAGTDAQMSRVYELVDEVVHERHVVEAEGDGLLAQILDLAFYGDVFSHHLAQELEIDPGPVAVWSEP